MNRYYLDTSIWLDFFENRNEPHLAKGDFAAKFISLVIDRDEKIIYSDAVKDEIAKYGFTFWEVERLFERFSKILVYVESDNRQFKRAKDLAAKRKVPIMDALHALIARDNKATVITRDRDFEKLKDIAGIRKPEDF